MRGIAALVVGVGHASTYAALPPATGLLAVMMALFNGHGSVVLFFVLSGFVLARSLEGRLGSANDLGVFYTKRLFRLYPALWAASLLGVAYVLLLHRAWPVPGASAWFNSLYTPGHDQPAYLARGMAVTAHILPQGWSIFVEIIASALLPLLAWLLFRRRWLFWAMASVLMVISFTVRESPYALAVYLVNFAIGAALVVPGADLRTRMAQPGRTGFALFISGLVLLLGTRLVWKTDYHDPGLQLVEAIGAALLIVAIVYTPIDLPWLRSKPAAEMGEISYSFYLLHFPVMCIAAKLIALVVSPAQSPGSFTVLLVAAVMGLTIPLSMLCYRWVEVPGVALGSRAVARLRRKPDVQEPAAP